MPYPENLEFEHIAGCHCKKCEEERKENLERQLELETKAKNKYCECIDWKEVMHMLSKDEQDEYNELVKKGGF